jgi:hypothetical protein
MAPAVLSACVSPIASGIKKQEETSAVVIDAAVQASPMYARPFPLSLPIQTAAAVVQEIHRCPISPCIQKIPRTLIALRHNQKIAEFRFFFSPFLNVGAGRAIL